MIGVYGGTFDPIHLGHLRAALEVLEGVPLTEMRFVPCGLPPHRAPPVADGVRRLAMVRAAIAGQPGFRVDDRELRRPGPSYMVDTLQSLREEQGQTPLCLVLGMDAFLGLQSWHRWERLVELAHLIVAHRPGWSPAQARRSEALAALLAKRATSDPATLRAAPAGAVLFQPVTPFDISSTAIRHCMAIGRSPRYLVPDSVHELMRTLHIYG